MEIYPESIRTGVPITVRAKISEAVGEIRVVPIGVQGATEFVVSTLSEPLGWSSAQFTLLLPGTYRLILGRETEEIQVADQINLSFGREFGIFCLGVFILVGGMLLWLRKTKKLD